MAGNIQKVRGTMDLLPDRCAEYSEAEKVLCDTARRLGFGEIRVPTFEKTALFCRTAGETSDVVSKEMYSFVDKGGDELTLRPEGTAGVVRAAIENGMINDALPQKLFYVSSCFRYNRPQAGRLREFHQFGVEILGADSYLADAELIMLADSAFKALGISQYITPKINSIGCSDCRREYQKALVAYFNQHTEALCGTCNERLLQNPMRVLDCKVEGCINLAAKAPMITDYLCDDCKTQFNGLCSVLDSLEIHYEVDPFIVRGLDYYNGTVFEFVTDMLGAQAAVCAGGRYDGLVSELGGPKTPALGFGLGIGRMMMLLEKAGIALGKKESCRLFIIPMGAAAMPMAAKLKAQLQNQKINCQTELANRSLKASMRYANKIGADFTMIIGEDEIKQNRYALKNMSDGEEIVVEDTIKLFEYLAV